MPAFAQQIQVVGMPMRMSAIAAPVPGGVVALRPVHAHEVLKVGPQGLGLLRSSMATGKVRDNS